MILECMVAAIAAAAPISLGEVRQESRANAQALFAALEQERAEQQVRVARSAILPQLTLNGTVGGALFGPQRTFSTVPEVDETGSVTGFTQRSVDVNTTATRASFELSATVGQLLYDGGRWWNQIAQAGALAEAEAGQAQEQRLASEFEGVRRFFELYRAQEVRNLFEANVKRSEAQVERAQALFEAGRGQRVDVFSARVNLGNDRLEVVRQAARIAAAQGDLAVWIARPGTQALVASAPDSLDRPAGFEATLEEAVKLARGQRPLLRSITGRLRAAELATDIARSDYLPRVTAQVTGGRQGPAADPFFTDPARQNFVQGGVNLRWDLFSGFATAAAVQQAEIARRRAELEVAQAERELEAEIRRAVVLFQTNQEAVEISRLNMETARQGLELAETRFQAGAGSTLEVRDAQLKLNQAELQLLQNRIDVEVARAALERAVGRGVAE